MTLLFLECGNVAEHGISLQDCNIKSAIPLILNPKWTRTLPLGILQKIIIEVDIWHPAVGLRCRIPPRQLSPKTAKNNKRDLIYEDILYLEGSLNYRLFWACIVHQVQSYTVCDKSSLDVEEKKCFKFFFPHVVLG
jgi:hypothetical protein